MLASRAVKPKLSLSISTAAQSTSKRPSLQLNLPSPVAMAPLRSPVSPSPISPTARNTRLNQRGYSTLQTPSFTYANTHSSSKSILKKGLSSSSERNVRDRRLKFDEKPKVYSLTPIEPEDEEAYYGKYTKMSREDRRWSRK